MSHEMQGTSRSLLLEGKARLNTIKHSNQLVALRCAAVPIPRSQPQCALHALRRAPHLFTKPNLIPRLCPGDLKGNCTPTALKNAGPSRSQPNSNMLELQSGICVRFFSCLNFILQPEFYTAPALRKCQRRCPPALSNVQVHSTLFSSSWTCASFRAPGCSARFHFRCLSVRPMLPKYQ
jgi:hypothetical protein